MKRTTVADFLEQYQLTTAAARLKELDLDPTMVEVEWNSRLRVTAGQCLTQDHGPGVACRIQLNPRLVDEGRDALVRTFLHELGHAVVAAIHGELGHTKRWRKECAALGWPNMTTTHRATSGATHTAS